MNIGADGTARRRAGDITLRVKITMNHPHCSSDRSPRPAVAWLVATVFSVVGPAAIRADEADNKWRYTLEVPADGWQEADFDASGWKQGDGGFGGHGYPERGHLWDAERDNWGYGGLPKTKREYRDRYARSLGILNGLRKQGVAGGVYTQTTDVEGEINGLMTYDRKVIKIPAEELRELHRQLFD